MTDLVNNAITNAEPIGWTAIIMAIIGIIARYLEKKKS